MTEYRSNNKLPFSRVRAAFGSWPEGPHKNAAESLRRKQVRLEFILIDMALQSTPVVTVVTENMRYLQLAI